MLLVIDVGNTNIVLGIYHDKKLLADWRLSTDPPRTADEYAMTVRGLLHNAGYTMETIDGVIVSSVVPDLMYSLEHMVRTYFKVDPIIVGPGIKCGINIKYDNPKEVGADRIVNAVAAHEIYGGNLIIIDFGTATTFCALTKDADYLGGSIAPGIKISSDALFARAAKLPRVELVKPGRVICKNTVQSMQSGIVYGYAGLVDNIVNKMKLEMKEYDGGKICVVATGGFASLISTESSVIDTVNGYLTLEGLRILYQRNIEQ